MADLQTSLLYGMQPPRPKPPKHVQCAAGSTWGPCTRHADRSFDGMRLCGHHFEVFAG